MNADFYERITKSSVKAIHYSNCWYLVSERTWVDGVFSSQGDTAEEDEEEDDVGEGGVVDDPVAKLPEPFNREHQLLTTDSKSLTLHFEAI